MIQLKYNEITRKQCFLQGFLLGIFSISLLVIGLPPTHQFWWLAAGAFPFLLEIGAAFLFKVPSAGKILITLGLALGIYLLFPLISSSPLFALFYGSVFLTFVYYLFSSRIRQIASVDREMSLELFRGSSLSLIILTMLSPLFVQDYQMYSAVCLCGFLTMLIFFGSYLNVFKEPSRKKRIIAGMLLTAVLSVVLAMNECIILPAFFLAVPGFCYAMFQSREDLKHFGIVMAHPGRSVFLTFAFLCAGGALLLRTPAAMTNGISVIDAAFTAVSGVCVTGLSVIDISSDLTLTGRFFLLILIQAGGLGIMTLAALVLHGLGKRLSLDQEQVLTELAPAQEQEVFQSLKQIVKVTFFCETIGAILLIPCFFFEHNDWGTAFELGVFTSISAFCNAGFFPNIDNLMPYSGNYFLLIVTALLIILGGIAPAVTISILHAGKKKYMLPLISKLVIGSTLLLLAGSTIFLLIFEWNGIFNGLSSTGKVINSFFLAASLRTAGFNTVAMGGSGAPAVIMMILCMFIGGSPGGTAGGIKTTTIAMIILTFRAAIRGENEAELDRHRIPEKSIIQAVSIICSAFLVLLLVIIMLTTTQTIGLRSLIFEAVSALGTVGLSLGATGELDFIGKIIIMITMFIGRIGSLTLFLLLSDRRSSRDSGYPPVRIPLG